MQNPTDVPAFHGGLKKQCKDTFVQAIADAAVPITKAFSTKYTAATAKVNQGTTASVSPDKAVELRMKQLEQLRYLQTLLDDGIINEKEFAEQKNSVMLSLSKLYVSIHASCKCLYIPVSHCSFLI